MAQWAVLPLKVGIHTEATLHGWAPFGMATARRRITAEPPPPQFNFFKRPDECVVISSDDEGDENSDDGDGVQPAPPLSVPITAKKRVTAEPPPPEFNFFKRPDECVVIPSDDEDGGEAAVSDSGPSVVANATAASSASGAHQASQKKKPKRKHTFTIDGCPCCSPAGDLAMQNPALSKMIGLAGRSGSRVEMEEYVCIFCSPSFPSVMRIVAIGRGLCAGSLHRVIICGRIRFYLGIRTRDRQY